MIIGNLLRVIIVGSIFVVLGVLSGEMIDRILQTISHDYVVASGQYRAEGWFWGLTLGGFAGLFIANSKTSSWSRMACGLLLGLVVMFLIAFFTAIGFCYAEKWFPTDSEALFFTSPRHQFCRGLIWGSGIGSLLGTATFIGVMSKEFAARETESATDSSQSDPEVCESDS